MTARATTSTRDPNSAPAPWRRRTALALAAVLMASVAAARITNSDASGSEPSPSSSGSPGLTESPGRVGAGLTSAVGAPIQWAACGPKVEGLQCASIPVPLDWDNPRGHTISLAVIRRPASKPHKRIGTLFINPGGPGESGVGLVQGDPAGVDAIGGGRFDVVSWDPRGTNASTRVQCFDDQADEARFWAGVSLPFTAGAAEPFRRQTVDLAQRCGRVSGWLLPHISTADTARDLNHLRVLMGGDKLTYVGLSYGSYLGQTYANMFPNQVRAMLLNGIVDAVEYANSAEARNTMWVSAAEKVFDQFLALCDRAGRARCALAGGNQTAAERVDRLFARLKRAPIPAVGAKPPLLSPATLSYSDLLASQFQPLRAPSTWPQNAADLAAALRGDGSALLEGASGFFAPGGWAAATISGAIQCADAGTELSSRDWLKVITRLDRISRLQGLMEGSWNAPCASWPVRGADAYRGPWNTATPNPILLINQRYDPNSDYRNAVRAERYLGNAVLLTHEGYGHLYFQNPSACVDEVMLEYLVHLVTPPKGTTCQSDHQPFDPELR